MKDMAFSYPDATFDDLDQRAVEKLIFEQSEGQFILKAHVFIERLLDTAIQRGVRRPECLNAADRLSFDLKVDLARALGVLPERMVSAIQALNGLRNRVVHTDDFRPSLAELRRLRLDWHPMQAKAFDAARAKSLEEAERIACLFLTWRCIHLVASPQVRGKTKTNPKDKG